MRQIKVIHEFTEKPMVRYREGGMNTTYIKIRAVEKDEGTLFPARYIICYNPILGIKEIKANDTKLEVYSMESKADYTLWESIKTKFRNQD